MQRLPFWLECYVLALPFDAGVPDNYVFHVKDHPSDPVEIGWEGFELGKFLGIRPEPPTGQIQSTTLWFRRAGLSAPTSFDALAVAFPEIADDSRKGAPPPESSSSPPSRPRTVVAATRIAPPPQDRSEQAISEWRGGMVTVCMMRLNQYLEEIAKVSSNLAVGPVVPTEFDPLLFGYRRYLPVETEAAVLPYAEHFCFVLHEYLPWVTEPLAQAQAQVANETSRGPRPFAEAETYLRGAERFELQENSRHAIIDACTAIELAVSAAVRFYGPLAGYNPTKVNNVVQGNFASRVKDHFATLFRFSGDVVNSTDALGVWWRHGYLRRNAVVHQGQLALRLHANEAVTAAKALLAETVRRIAADGRFTSIPSS